MCVCRKKHSNVSSTLMPLTFRYGHVLYMGSIQRHACVWQVQQYSPTFACVSTNAHVFLQHTIFSVRGHAFSVAHTHFRFARITA